MREDVSLSGTWQHAGEEHALCSYQSQVCTAEGHQRHCRGQDGVGGGHHRERPGFPILRLRQPMFSTEQKVTEIKGKNDRETESEAEITTGTVTQTHSVSRKKCCRARGDRHTDTERRVGWGDHSSREGQRWKQGGKWSHHRERRSQLPTQLGCAHPKGQVQEPSQGLAQGLSPLAGAHGAVLSFLCGAELAQASPSLFPSRLCSRTAPLGASPRVLQASCITRSLSTYCLPPSARTAS